MTMMTVETTVTKRDVVWCNIYENDTFIDSTMHEQTYIQTLSAHFPGQWA